VEKLAVLKTVSGAHHACDAAASADKLTDMDCQRSLPRSLGLSLGAQRRGRAYRRSGGIESSCQL
jgi:hypothetical protein